ncbi:hypothetical protein [Campylobacter concisus]|uniref:hypothetical protein n=1 Tax=Campylobacter concisus TaxID=199 RepID=UPI001F3C834C|nr:hypothetical protein [Campylobacter concisus]
MTYQSSPYNGRVKYQHKSPSHKLSNGYAYTKLYASGENIGGVHEPQPSRVVVITDRLTFSIITAKTIC